MTNRDRSTVVRIGKAQSLIPGPAGEHNATLFQRGSVTVKLSIPRKRRDTQTPHAQDEIYVIVRGQGVFVHGSARDAFGAGDLLFVAAGTEHRFEEFTEDLEVWVIFYGATGGEVPVSA
jgi:mannose-6-phosphate isomerase-like protein (cupin superfamily)